MPTEHRYPIPAETCRVAEEIKRSRFITTVAYTPTPEDARAFIDRVRAEFPDAGHNCWAYVAGPPGSTLTVGMSDDGEPRGTAGKPMLSVLLNSGVGDLAAVVTRYWGFSWPKMTTRCRRLRCLLRRPHWQCRRS